MKSLLHFSKFKKVFFLLLFAELMNLPAFANPGDTTWVSVFNARKITYHGNYDTTAVFPTGKHYRKIRLHYILGRYQCVPMPNPPYCGSWDYTTEVRVLPAGKDSVEIARVITPYATDWWTSATVNKKHEYIMDVTDYASVLDGTNTFRFVYDGWSWGFTLTLKLEFIEGTPPMDALSVKNVYDGYFGYGAASTSTNYIENYLNAKTFISFIAPVYNVYLRNTVSGHGSDATGCSEFCSKYYNLKVNGNQVSQVQLWKPDCGWNEEYAQTGTWIYDRANWCPGEVVKPIFHNLTSLINTNATYSLDVDMQPYTVSNPSGGYNWVAQLISYSAANYTIDAAIEDIISPTTADDYRREGPTCANPVIKLKNTGTTPITEVVFNYGLRGQTPSSFTWTTDDALISLHDTLIVFPSLSSVLSSSLSNNYFDVSIASVNGAADENQYNNIYAAKVPSVQALPEELIVKLTDSNGGSGETSWHLYDENDNVVSGGQGASEESILLDAGCYRIVVEDSGCDGLNFMNTTEGALRIYRSNGTTTLYTFPPNFGCGFTKYFYVAHQDVGISKNTLNSNAVSIYPNPANNTVRIKFNISNTQNATIKLLDINGRLIQQKNTGKSSMNYETLDLSSVSNGVYIVSIQLENNAAITKKLVIQK